MGNRTYAYRVSADVRYLDGSLEGLVISDGWTTTYPTIELAQAAAQWAKRCYLAGVEVGAGYLIVSAPVVEVAK